jgi:hypothetical protein
MRAHLSTLVLALVAVVLGVIAYLGFSFRPLAHAMAYRWSLILPRMVPAIFIAGRRR